MNDDDIGHLDPDLMYCDDCGQLIDSTAAGCPCRTGVDVRGAWLLARGRVDDAVTLLLRARLALHNAGIDSHPICATLNDLREAVADVRDRIDGP